MPRGKILRVILAAQATVVWSTDGWALTNHLDANHEDVLNLWFVDLPSVAWPANSVVEFTIFWVEDRRWEGRNWQVKVL
jgi:glucoamylase